MKIVVFTGSPRLHGNSNMLADAFCAGATLAGHQISRFNAAVLKIKPCTACDWCRVHGGRCICGDAMTDIYPRLAESDMVVFATPLYYYGMSSQLKALIDRFYALEGRMEGKKAVLLGSCEDDDGVAMIPLEAHYDAICRHCGWESVGSVLAYGVSAAGDVSATEYLDQARSIGRMLKSE